MKSYKTEMYVQGEWVANGCRYATKDEAEQAGAELIRRWTQPSDYRATESEDAVNYEFKDGYPQSIKSAESK